MRKVVVYIAMSLDGYIAKLGDNLDFLNVVQQEGEDYGYTEFIKTIDTIIMGRKTYDWVMKQVPEFPHADKETYIITRTPKPSIGKINFYTGEIKELISHIKKGTGKNIFVDGGAEVVNTLMKDNLIDEYIISIIPIFVGEGTQLFKTGRPELPLQLVNVKSFVKGLVQLHYTKNI